MELDFTRLNSLAFIAPKKPSETQKGEGEYKTPIEAKKPVETLTEGLEGINKLQREADRKKQDIDRSLAICREYQQNIKTSSQLQTEILKGVRAGEDIYSLFLWVPIGIYQNRRIYQCSECGRKIIASKSDHFY